MTSPSRILLDDAFYGRFSQLLFEELPDYSAPEIQGILTGLVCAGMTDAEYDQWRPLLAGSQDNDPTDDRLKDALSALMALTEKSLRAQDFSYRPLLPPDSDSVASRTQALADWSYGFGMGLNWNGRVKPAELEADAQDAIEDISELASVDIVSANPDDESAIVELEEYLRVAAQLIFESAGCSESFNKEQ